MSTWKIGRPKGQKNLYVNVGYLENWSLAAQI